MKIKRIIALVVAAVTIALFIGGLVSRHNAMRIADSAMKKLIPYGWHIDRVRFLPAINGPFWMVTYQNADYPSCFPFQVTMSMTGKIFQQPPLELLEEIESEIMTEN